MHVIRLRHVAPSVLTITQAFSLKCLRMLDLGLRAFSSLTLGYYVPGRWPAKKDSKIPPRKAFAYLWVIACGHGHGHGHVYGQPTAGEFEVDFGHGHGHGHVHEYGQPTGSFSPLQDLGSRVS